MESPGKTVDHSTRSKLFDLISKEPGLSLMEIVKALKLKESTLRYHLKYMEKNQIIECENIDGKRRYFSPGTRHNKRKKRKRIEIGLSGKQKILLSIIGDNPGIDQKKLSTLSRFNRFVVSYQLDKFEKLGLVKKKRLGKFVRYFKVDEEDLRKKIISAMVDDLSEGRMDEERFLKLLDRLEK